MPILSKHSNPTICFVGYPSSGKSTLINSILLKRFFQSGLSRTTTNPQLIGNENIHGIEKFIKEPVVSDDGYDINLLDLPGICDSQDNTKYFDNVMYENVVKCEIIAWVTPIESAFITNGEVEKFNDLVSFLKLDSLKTGRYHKVVIFITKANDEYEVVHDNEDSEYFKAKQVIIETSNENGEICGNEETGLYDNVIRVHKLFGENHLIFPFNSYGRICYKNSSPSLKQLISPYIPILKPINIEFNLGWYFEKVNDNLQSNLLKSFEYNVSNSIDKKDYNFNTIKNVFDNIDNYEIIIKCLLFLSKKFVNSDNSRDYIITLTESLKISTKSDYDEPTQESILNELNLKNIKKSIIMLFMFFGFSRFFKYHYFTGIVNYKKLSYSHNEEEIEFSNIHDLNNDKIICYPIHELDRRLEENPFIVLDNNFIKEVENERELIYGKSHINIYGLCEMFNNEKVITVLINFKELIKPSKKIIEFHKSNDINSDVEVYDNNEDYDLELGVCELKLKDEFDF